MPRPLRATARRAAVVSFAVALVLLYLAAWSDLLANGWVEPTAGGILRGIPKSFEYLVLWVMPFWWLLLLMFVAVATAGATAIAALRQGRKT